MPRRGGDGGAVTVEAAIALATLTVFVALAIGALVAVMQSVRCVDAARELARLAARGEPDRGRAVASELAPAGARLEVTTDGDTLTAIVTAQLVSPLPVAVSGRAVAALEGPPAATSDGHDAPRQHAAGSTGHGAAGDSAAGVSATGVSAAGVSAAGVSAAGVSAAGARGVRVRAGRARAGRPP